MQSVNDLPNDLQRALKGRDVIVFDGVCVLCSAFFRFVLQRDRAERFCFVRAQSDLGLALYRALDLPTDDFETNLVITGGRIWRKLDAFAMVMLCLGAPWSVLSALRWLPRPLKDPAYHLIARNRYRLFGKTETCLMPDAAQMARFLDADAVGAST